VQQPANSTLLAAIRSNRLSFAFIISLNIQYASKLRPNQGYVQYRLLYFFHGRQVAILTHSLTKEDKIPEVDIERAIKRKKLLESKPKEHTYESES